MTIYFFMSLYVYKVHGIDRNNQCFNFSLVLWDFLKRMKTLDIKGPPCGPYCSHVVSMKKRRVYSTLSWVFSSLVSPLHQQDIGFEESEINEPHSVLLV